MDTALDTTDLSIHSFLTGMMLDRNVTGAVTIATNIRTRQDGRNRRYVTSAGTHIIGASSHIQLYCWLCVKPMERA